MTTAKKRSIVLQGHPTSVSLEEPFWAVLKDLAAARRLTLAALISKVDADRQGSLSGALRLFVLDSLLKRLENDEKLP